MHLLTVTANRIASASNISGAAQAVALNKSKAFNNIWQADLLTNLIAMASLSETDNFVGFCLGSFHKSILLMIRFLRAPFVVLLFCSCRLQIFTCR